MDVYDTAGRNLQGNGWVTSRLISIFKKRMIMNVTFMICNEKAEVIWNAIRQANIMLDEMHDVNIFLNSKSVNYEEFDSEKFNINELLKIFTLSEGNLYA